MVQVSKQNKSPSSRANGAHPVNVTVLTPSTTRKQDLADGKLIDLSDLAMPVFWLWPVACSSEVYAALVSKGVDAKKEGEDGATYRARARQLVVASWDAAHARLKQGNPPSETVTFLARTDAGTAAVFAKAAPGDDGKPCVTIRLVSEH